MKLPTRLATHLIVLVSLSVTLPICDYAWAGTRVVKKKIFSVVKDSVKYSCYAHKKKSLLVFKQKGVYVIGDEAVKELKKSLTSSGQIKKSLGKKKLAKLKLRVKNGNYACQNPSSDDPGGGGNGGGSVSLTKLGRPLTRADIQYLLDKAALGLSSREEYLVNIGINQGIDALVDELMLAHPEPAGLMDRVLDSLDGVIGASTSQAPVGQRAALLDLWINTNNPYQEKFALFLLSVWTAAGDVIDDETFRYAFWDYYQRLREHSYGSDSVPNLAVAITRDPLMLVYLNNELNVKGNPNENYARELMELFTLGPVNLDGVPNYTETQPDGSGDIANAAKMLTGWKVHKNYLINKLVAISDQSRHQSGPHVMFPGTPNQFVGDNDEDLVRGIFAHHAGAKQYYAKEILKVYLTPNPPRSLVDNFAEVISSNGFRLRDAMKSLLKSEAFYDSAYKDTVPMNSFEFAAKTARMLELYNAVNVSYAEWQLQKMGLLYNMAPSVFWYNPDTWNSSSIALEKANYLAEILGNNTALNGAGWTAAKVLPSGAVGNLDLISHVQSRVGLTLINEPQRQSMIGYLSTELQYNGVYTPYSYSNTNPNHQKTKGLGLFYLLFTSPEFNLL